jgi:hypothetical protein
MTPRSERPPQRELRLLAGELERQLDELLAAAGDRRVRPATDERRTRLDRYVGDMSRAERLRLAAALHLLSRRLDGDLATPDARR